MAPITGKFIGDFASFNDAVQGATAKLTSFETGAGKVEKSLNRMVDSFSGKKLIQDATLMAEAVEKIGGTAALTENELRRLATTTNDAVNKMRAMGIDVPEKLQHIADQTRQLTTATGEAATGFSKVGAAIGSFIGNFASNLLQNGISSLINMGKAAFESAGQINDLSQQLGISAEAVQGLSHAAEQSGTSIETIGAAIGKLNLNVAGGAESTKKALDALAKASGDVGVQWEKLRQLSPEQQFFALTDALMKVDNHQAMVRLGTELMGKGFAEITPAIQEDLRKTAESAATMSDETVKRLAAAEDAWANLSRRATIATGEIIGKVLENAQKLDDAAKMMTPMERLQEYGPAAAILTNLGIAYGFISTEVQRNTKDIELHVTAMGQDRDAALDNAEAQKKAAEEARKQADIYRAVDAALAALTATEERHRGALVALGLATEQQVNKQLAEYVALQEQAAFDGADHDRVLVALLPKLTALAKQAKAAGVEVEGLAAAQREAFEAWERLNPAINDSVQGYVDLATVLPLATKEAERLNTIMSPEQWNAAKATEAMKRMGITSRAELESIARQAERDYAAIVAAVGKSAPEAVAAFKKMIEAQKAASGELPTFWEKDILPRLKALWEELPDLLGDNFAKMLTGAQSFKEGFVAIWDGIKQSLTQVLAEMLSHYLKVFIQGLVDGLIRAGLDRLFSGQAGGGSPYISYPGTGGSSGGIGGGDNRPPWQTGGGNNFSGMPGAGGGSQYSGGGTPSVNSARDYFFSQFVKAYGQSPFASLAKAFTEAGVMGDIAERQIAQLYAAKNYRDLEIAMELITETLNAAAANASTLAATSQSPATLNIEPGAIVVNGADRDPVELAREIAAALVRVVVRENPEGARTMLRQGLVA